MKKSFHFKNTAKIPCGVTFGSRLVLEKVEKLEDRVPELIRLYVEFGLPSDSVFSEGLEVLGPDRFVDQNFNFSPAIFIRQLGFWTIATTYGGDAFIIDTESGKVMIIDTGMLFYEKGIPMGLGPNGREAISKSFVQKICQIQAATWVDFMKMI